MTEFPTYPEYKPSNIEWLGDIPQHWSIWKVTHGFNRIGSGTTPKSDNQIFYDGDIPWVTTSELREIVILDTAQKVTEEAVSSYSALKVYPKGSLAIAMYGATIGRLGMLGVDATFNQACCVFSEPTVFDARFVYYWLWMRRPILISISNGGGQPNLSQDDLKKLWIPIPDINEQQAIARFLDFKTAQIDALIAKKQALLDKLAEKRTALISHAVTKGLDPSAPMKDSGVVWLGEIPKHWNAVRLRYASEFVTSGSRGWAEFYSNEGYVFLRITNVSRISIQPLLEDIRRVSPPDTAEGKRTATKGGDVVISITADLGSVAVIPEKFEPAYVSQHLALVRPNIDRVSGQWMAYQIFSSAGQAQLLGAGYGGTKIQLGLEDIKDLWLAFPPIHEQQEICSYIGGAVDAMERQVEFINKVISRLREYRAALITNAVTGKIDVRNWQPNQETA
ncbi:restriction endonuclease subunit S [Methylocaldum sp. MU1018]